MLILSILRNPILPDPNDTFGVIFFSVAVTWTAACIGAYAYFVYQNRERGADAFKF